MFPSDLWSEHDDYLHEQALAGRTPAEIEEKLRGAEDVMCFSVAQVRARLRHLKLPVNEAPIDLEQEVWASLATNLEDLAQIEARMRDLDHLAYNENAAVPPLLRVAATQQNLAKRASLILSKHKLLQSALTERLKRKLLEAQIATEERVREVRAQPPKLPARAPESPALPEAANQSFEAPAAAPASAVSH